jgi:hypothetical protein
LTTVKPSGTLSLLAGVTPGAHPGFAQYMFRRITIDSESPLIEVCREHNVPLEYKRNLDGTDDYGSMIATFPFAFPEGTVLAKDMTAIDQLNNVRYLQKVWSDNSVSCTIYYKKEEIPEIREYLRKYYRDGHKTVSFLLHQDHGFDQAPYEEVTKEQYEELNQKVTPIASVNFAEFEGDDECASGACPVK